jgi:hypothetical protein
MADPYIKNNEALIPENLAKNFDVRFVLLRARLVKSSLIIYLIFNFSYILYILLEMLNIFIKEFKPDLNTYLMKWKIINIIM